jgi:hypothetical protein
MEWGLGKLIGQFAMDSEILINVTRDEIRVGLLEGGQVVPSSMSRGRMQALSGIYIRGGS